ncbi:hypothetical protein ABMA27_011875 [Loxostege sticticalis]|uniref:Uncharacterized protein n=1 Tax=Loxostege sticticalis TaxID=481309 RepID=A0ABR3IHX7_LOXSC
MWFYNRNLVILIVLQAYMVMTQVGTYHDVFLPGAGGKPTLGTTKATCWARGGICIHIQYCTTFQFDTSVAGCTTERRVCCKMHKFGSPTVGPARKSGPLVSSSSLGELDLQSVRDVAAVNAYILQRM